MESTLEKFEIINLGERILADQNDVDAIDKQLEDLQKRKKDLEANILTNKKALLNLLEDETPFETNVFVAKKSHSESVGYSNETEVLQALKDNDYTNYIRIKTTEALDKNELKKALKTDEKLKNLLDSYTTTKRTDYVIVTTPENYKLMLEHIEKGKK